VRRFVRHLEDKGLSQGSVVKNLVPFKALFATAVDGEDLRADPSTRVRVNRQREDAEEEVGHGDDPRGARARSRRAT